MFKKLLAIGSVAITLVFSGCGGESTSDPDPALEPIAGFWQVPSPGAQIYQSIGSYGAGVAYTEDVNNNCFNTIAIQYVHLSDETFRRSFPEDASFPPEDFGMLLLPNGSLQVTFVDDTSVEWAPITAFMPVDVSVCQ